MTTLDNFSCVNILTIMDNLFWIQGIIDLSRVEEFDVGVLSIDQDKASDRVYHSFLLRTLEGFGFGKIVISWIKLLYSGSSVLLKWGVDSANQCLFREVSDRVVPYLGCYMPWPLSVS